MLAFGGGSRTGGSGASRSAGHPIFPSPDASPAPVSSPEIVGPFDHQFFNATSSLPSGTSNYALGSEIDPSTGMAFAANAVAGTVTEFDLNSGVVIDSAIITQYVGGASYLRGIVLDGLDHTLFVLVDTRGVDGYVVVLNESDLVEVANLTFNTFSEPPFEPIFGAWDPTTDQVFIEGTMEDGSMIDVVAIDAASDEFAPATLIPWTGTEAFGLTVIPEGGYSFLVAGTGTAEVYVWNTSGASDLLKEILIGPTGSVATYSAYDTVDHQLVVLDDSTVHNSSFLQMNATSGTFTVQGPPYHVAPENASAMAYDPDGDVLVVSDFNHTAEILTYDATSGAVQAAWHGNPSGAARHFTSLTVDTADDEVLASGTLNNTTISFELPNLSVARYFSSFPFAQRGVAEDVGLGIQFVEGVDPDVLQAVWMSNASVVWTDYLSPAPEPNVIAYDPVNSTLFVASNVTGIVTVLNGSTGATLPYSIQLAAPPDRIISIAVDGTNDVLYVGTSDRLISFYDTTTGAALGSPQSTVILPCVLLVNVTADAAYFADCTAQGSVGTALGNSTVIPTYANVGSDPDALALGPTGSLYTLNAGNDTISVIEIPSGQNLTPGSVVQNISLGAQTPRSIAFDTTNGLLFVPANNTLTVAVANGSGSTSFASFSQPSELWSLSYYPASPSLFGIETYTGQVFVAIPAALPAAPTDLTLAGGNSSVTAVWLPPVSDGGAPILSYQALIGTGPAGPWIQSISVDPPSANFSGLINGLTYYVVVRATNAVGSGNTTEPMEAVPRSVPYPPFDLKLVGATNDSLNVNWSAPSETGGSLFLTYVLNYSIAGTVNWSTIAGITGTNWNISGLRPGINYTVQVAAANDLGDGGFSSPVTLGTLPGPGSGGPPSGTTGSSSKGGGNVLTKGDWLGILVLITAVGILVGVAFWSRQPRPPVIEPAPPRPPAPWDESTEPPTYH
jgi:WD40 repeat protein